MPKYDCVRKLKIEAVSIHTNDLLWKGQVSDISPQPGSVANRYLITTGRNQSRLVCLDRIDINRLSEITTREVIIFDRTNMVNYKFTKVN